MTPQGIFRRQAALMIAVLAAAGALAPTAGAKSVPSNGNLSSRLAELAKPSVRIAPPGEQAAILDVAASGPGSLLREGNRVLVDVRFSHGAAAGVDALRDAGAKILHVSRRYQTVTAAVAPGFLHQVSDVPRVEGVAENLSPIVFGAGDPGPIASVVNPCFGAATSEGDTQLNAMLARDAFGVDGTGVTVGILSDSFSRSATAPTSAAGDVASGDLPGSGNPCERTTPVDAGGDTFGGRASDEGRAMAQIVHDLAPGARITFATAFVSMTSFADNIRALRDAGAKVIVDDVIYLEEPFFQEGPVGVAVSDVTTSEVAYFTAAGNNNLISGGRDIASWEAPSFRDSTCPAALEAALTAERCMDFDPGVDVDPTYEVTVSRGARLTVNLQWNEPWNGVTTDLDIFLLDSSDNPIQVEGSFVGSAQDNVSGSQRPVEILQWENRSGSSQRVRLAIDRCIGTCNPATNPLSTPRLKLALLQNGSGVTSTEYPESAGGDLVGPTIFGHSGAEHAMSVGAVRFNTSSAPEAFSSRGPVKHYFGPVNGTIPAGSIPEKVLAKPDIVATDGGANTFFGTCSSNIRRFFGTSAAAPHAAAVAALEFEASPASSPAAIKDAQIDNALPIGGFLPPAVGAGIVDAFAAIDSLVGPMPGSQAPQSTLPNCNLPPAPPLPPATPPVAEPTVFSAPPAAKKKRDRIRPRTRIVKKPAKATSTPRKRKLISFRFRSSKRGSAFLCRIDRGRWHQCYRTLTRWFGLGKHVIRVKARDAAGNVDRTPAVYRFRIKRRG